MTYLQKKNAVRFAVKTHWEEKIAGKNVSWGEIAQFTNWAELCAKRYGLLKEFRENGII